MNEAPTNKFPGARQLDDMSVTFVSDGVPADRKHKAVSKLLTFFEKLYNENPEVARVQWSRGNER